MRLIDADDVKELINGLDSLPWEEEVDDLVNTIPTAYYVEKVVAELEDLESKSFKKCKEEIELFKEEFWRGGMTALQKAIDIVRKGGVF